MLKQLLGLILNIAILGSMFLIYKSSMDEGYAEATVINELPRTSHYQQLIAEQDRHCLAKNIYFEARSDSLTGQRAVAWVTLNRVKSESFPDSICGVVYQARLDSSGRPKKNQCQFSWYCDGKDDDPKNMELWVQANDIAASVIRKYELDTDPTEGATYYHATYVSPSWSKTFEKTVRIDTHIFYR